MIAMHLRCKGMASPCISAAQLYTSTPFGCFASRQSFGVSGVSGEQSGMGCIRCIRCTTVSLHLIHLMTFGSSASHRKCKVVQLHSSTFFRVYFLHLGCTNAIAQMHLLSCAPLVPPGHLGAPPVHIQLCWQSSHQS